MIKFARNFSHVKYAFLLSAVILILVSSASSLNASTMRPDTPLTHEEIEQGLRDLTEFDLPFVLNIYFDTDSDVVSPEFQKMLASLSDTLATMKHYHFKLNIIGHTDSRASRTYNHALGLRRAEAVKSYLAPSLFDVVTISKVISKGQDAPNSDNSSEMGKALNRRVEIEIAPAMRESIKANNQIVFSGAGDAFLLNQGNQLILWNTVAQCPQSMLNPYSDQVYVSAISPNNLLAMSGGENQKVILWDVLTTSIITEFTGHQAAVTALSFSNNNRVAISGAMDGEIRVWELLGKKQITVLNGHETPVTAVALASNGEYAVSGDASGLVILWDIVAFTEISRLKVHESAVTDISFNEKNDAFLSSSRRNGLHISHIDNKKSYWGGDGKSALIVRFDISRNGQELLTLVDSGDILVWQTRTRKRMMMIESSQHKLKSVTYSSNDEIIMASDVNKAVHMWDATTGEYISKLDTKSWQEGGNFPAQGEFDGQRWFDRQSLSDFTWFQGKCFEMGCGPWNNNCSSSEKPLHNVCVEGFWMANNEVTVEQWRDFNGYAPLGKKQDECDDEECQVEAVNQVSWMDAQLFMCKLNKSAGQIYRLPTEAEWEYACRDKGEKIKYYNQSGRTASTGLNNMNTGVWEWTLDAFNSDSYQNHVRHNPVDSGDNNFHFMQGNIYRAVRGGAWDKGSKTSQCSRRFYDDPASRNFYTGFRLVKPGY